MVDEGRDAGQEEAERRIGDVANPFGEVRGEPLGVTGQEQAATAEAGTRLDRRLEKGPAVQVRRARREGDRRRAGVQERVEVSGSGVASRSS